MKLFILLSRFPFPLEKGDKLRAFHQIKELSSKYEIHLCCLTDQKVKTEWKAELAPYCKSIHIYELSKPLIYWNAAKQIFSDKPYQVGYFFQSRIQRKIVQLIQQLKPDHIYCQLIRTAEYVKNIHNIPKTIDYQDALSKGMFRRAEISSGIRKALFQSEGKRLSAYENRIFDYFNHHCIISEQDRNLINHPAKDKIVVIENGIDLRFFEDFDSEKKYDLVFTGNMNYPPNIECAEYLVKQILPLLPEETTVLLSGASPNQRIIQLAQDNKVTITGWVDDIRVSYASAKIFVAPLFIGTGLQNKLLEAMAMGLPSVTTSLANNALNANENKEILLAENAEEFSNKISQLLSNNTASIQLGQAGKAFVASNYSWSESVDKLDSLLLGSNEKTL